MKSKNTEEKVKNLLKDQLNSDVSHKDILKMLTQVVLESFSELLAEEVNQKAGGRYSHETAKYDRWGSNPGSIQIGEEKVRLNVPRLLNKEAGKTESPDIYKQMKKLPAPKERVLKKIAYGMSQKDYEEVTRTLDENFGISQSSVSRKFKEKSREILEEMDRRDLGCHEFLALIVDGKYLKREQVIIALGVTTTGFKIPLGFIHAATENSIAVKGLFKNLIQRNFRFDEGILVITDGSTGMIKAVKETFGDLAVRQRCQWHKRENVVGLLKEEHKEIFKSRIQRAYRENDYGEAKSQLLDILKELEKINYSAANSMREGLEETLTLHRIGMYETFGVTFSTTNAIENVNSLIEKHTRKIKRWRNGEMLARWVAVALTFIEPRLKRLDRYKKLRILKTAITEEVNRKQRKAG